MSSSLRVKVFGDANTVPAVCGVLEQEEELAVGSFSAARPLAGAIVLRSAKVAHGVMASASPKIFERARRRGCLTANHWVGTDVHETLSEPSLRKRLKAAPIDLHLAVAPWLVEELKTIGIEARELPIVPPDLAPKPLPLPRAHAVLAYAALGREDFYGLPTVLELARRFALVPFYLCGGGRLPADTPENVTAVGKVSRKKMDDLYTKSTVLLRLPTHDGLSKMVLEALAYGREVIWNHPFEGIHVATSAQHAGEILEEIFAAPPRVNERAWAALRGPYAPRTVAARALALYRGVLDPSEARK